MFQVRRKEPRAGSRDPWYNPERDLAHIGPPLCKAACVALEEKFWEPWFKEYMEDQGYTVEDLVCAALPFAKGLNKIIGKNDPVVALQESGFSELPPPLQAAFYIKLGQVFLAAVWGGVKDISRPDSDPPAEMQELLNEIEAQFNKLAGVADDTCGSVAPAADTDGPVSGS